MDQPSLPGMTDKPRRLKLDTGLNAGFDGQPAAIYVMVAADGLHAKVGAVERAGNAAPRLLGVERAQRKRGRAECSFPIRLAVVAELAGLVLGPEGASGRAERWELVWHLEATLRLVLAARLGGLSAVSEWVWLARALDDDLWEVEVREAWGAVRPLLSPSGATSEPVGPALRASSSPRDRPRSGPLSAVG